MEYKATAKYLRISPRKARLLAGAIGKMSPTTALAHLATLSRKGSKVLIDVINTALSSAKAKSADVNKLRFKTIEVMEGSRLKRWRAVSRGMAHGYKKRLTHLRIILTDEVEKEK